MSNIRIVALDLDGTLLNHKNEVSPATRQAIAQAVEQGVVVLPATGRALANLPAEVAQLPGIRYAITSNGASVWDLGADPLAAVYSRYADAAQRKTAQPACVFRSLFPAEKAREVFALYAEYPGALSIFADGRVFRDARSQALMGERLHRFSTTTEGRQPNDGRFHIIRDAAEWMSRHAHEVEKFCMFFDTAEQAKAALPRFYAVEGIEVVQGSPDNLEVTYQGVDKGEALLALADRLGLPRESTLAVGDSENDRAMLEKAGTAAVMANGMEHIKALADYVSEADCDHDGVAEIFRKRVL